MQVSHRERVAIVLLAGAGAAFLPGALDRFVFPKLALLAAGTALAAGVPARGALPRLAVAGLSLAALLLLVATLASQSQLAGAIGRAPRYEGAVALSVYLGCVAAGARLLGTERSPTTSRLLLDTLALAALAIGAVAVLEAFGLRPLTSNVSRPGSLLGNASDQGAWALLALGPLTAAALHNRDSLHLAGALAAAAALATSGSRGALAGALIAALVLAVTVDRARRRALAASIAVLAVGVLALPAERARVIQTSPLAQHTSNGRLLLWAETLQLIGDHPLLGTGPSGYEDAIPAYNTRSYEQQVGPANPPDSPHNWVLQAASAGGIPLVLLALVLASLTFARGARALQRAPPRPDRTLTAGMLAGLTGYTVALLFYFTTAGSTPLAALYAGALLAGLAGRSHRRVRRWARIAASVAYGILTVLLTSAALAELPLRTALLQAAAGRLAAADGHFHAAQDLRPWDPAIAQTAAHAYAVLAHDHAPSAVHFGLPWADDELRADPHSIQALQDAATLQHAAGHRAEARRLLNIALGLDPRNPDLLSAVARR